MVTLRRLHAQHRVESNVGDKNGGPATGPDLVQLDATCQAPVDFLMTARAGGMDGRASAELTGRGGGLRAVFLQDRLSSQVP